MQQKITVQLTPFELAIINQAIAYYKVKVDVILNKVEDNFEKNLFDFAHRLRWLITETAATQAKITAGVPNEYLVLSQYQPQN